MNMSGVELGKCSYTHTSFIVLFIRRSGHESDNVLSDVVPDTWGFKLVLLSSCMRAGWEDTVKGYLEKHNP